MTTCNLNNSCFICTFIILHEKSFHNFLSPNVYYIIDEMQKHASWYEKLTYNQFKKSENWNKICSWDKTAKNSVVVLHYIPLSKILNFANKMLFFYWPVKKHFQFYNLKLYLYLQRCYQLCSKWYLIVQK